MRTLIALLALCSIASADVVYLKNGGKIEGRVTQDDTTVKVDTGYGTVTLKREDVDRIEKKDFTSPERPVLKKTPPRLRDAFAHPFFGFKIYLPAGWAKGPDKEPQKISFYGPKDQLYTPRFDLTVRQTKMGVADFVNALKTTYLKEYKDVLFQYEEVMSLHGRESYQFLVLFGDGGIKMRSIWTVVGTEGLLYTIGFSCTDAWFEKYYSMVDASMRSLRLYPLPAAPLEKRKEFDQLYQQGYAMAKDGKTAEALKAFTKAAEIIPEFATVHGIVGQLQSKAKNFADAEKSFRKALELDPDDYEFAFNLGVILLQQQKFDAAIDALSKAVKADPTMEPALTNLGVAYLSKDVADKAAETLSKAVLADPESAPAHYNLGFAHERLGKTKEAEKEYREALKIDPEHQGAKDGLARIKK